MQSGSGSTEHTLIDDFHAETAARTIADVKRAVLVASIAFAFFGLLDAILYPELCVQLITIRIAVILCNITIYLFVRNSLLSKHIRVVAMLEYLICGISIVLMVHLTGGYSSPYYAGINLVLIFFIFILPLGGYRTLIVCTIIYLTYIVPILASPDGVSDFPIFLNNNFFLVTTIGLVIMSAYLAESMSFKEFRARYRLAQANEELQTMDVLKSQFFANVSHEVRTPLTSIISPVQGLYQGDAGELTREQHQLIAQVYRNSLRLLDMINQMLDFAKYDARRMQLRLTWVNVGDICLEMIAAFSDVCKRKGLALRSKVPVGVSGAYLDQDKIERILSNLLRNAIKFTDRGAIVVSLNSDETSLTLSVQDTGIGIPPDRITTIFERFRQVDGSSTRRYEGTGLGLAIVKEAAELMHGSIEVDSTPGKGTAFTVKLPRNLEELAPDAMIERREREDRRVRDVAYNGPERRRTARRRQDFAHLSLRELAMMESQSIESQLAGMDQTPLVPAGDAIRVLYVEDNADLRTFVRKMLENHGYAVTVASDGLEGWRLVEEMQPEVIVTDVMMPHMDGFELLRRVRENEHFRRLPVILITAKSEMDSRIEGLESGADDYLAKPINIRELDARIKNLIHLRKLQESEVREVNLEERIQELSLSFARTLELRDRYTAGHSNDVLNYGSLIAEELGVPVDTTLREALLLHDIGKLGIPDSILLKSGPLTDEEWEVMKSHAELGASLLGAFDTFERVSSVILAHQEHFDGTGYPRGLKSDEIPIEARIISVADSWHAMTEDRPYRRALTKPEAIAELVTNSGRQFDPEVVDAFLRGLVKQKVISREDLRRGGAGGS